MNLRRIYHGCEGWIEKISPEDHRLESQGLPSDDNIDHEGWIFRSHPQTNNGFFSCSSLKTAIYALKMLPEVPEYAEYAEMRHNMMASF